MAEFNSSLLREKFVIRDTGNKAKEAGAPLVALSNRFVVKMESKNGKYEEIFVVRAHNMHSCIRMSARIVQAFNQGGPLMNRQTPFEWEKAWDSIVNDYERNFNPQRWIAVYSKGRLVFEAGEHHAFLDMIEQCDIRNNDLYDNSVVLAEELFKEAGKTVTIEHDANVALVVTFENNEGRVGIILRGPDRTTTFNFTVSGTTDSPVSTPQCLAASAAFLEGIQLAFMVGMNNEKIRIGLIERFSKEEKQTREAKKRLARLNAEIANLESSYDLNYRPERPEFPHIVMDAEKLAQQVLKPPPSSKDNKDDEDEIYID